MSTHTQANLDFANIIQESLNEIYIFDVKSLKFIFVNKSACNNIGYSMSELCKLTPVDIKPQHDDQSFQQTISALVDGTQKKIQFETTHRRKDQSDYEVEVHLQQGQFNDRDVFIAIILDISDRTQASEELAFSKSLLESAPDAMIVADASGKVHIANRQMGNLLGYSQDELLTMNVDDFVPDSLRAEHALHRKNYNQEPRVRGMGKGPDLSALTKDGKMIPIEVSLSPIKTPSQRYVSAAIRDVSERKNTEEKLMQSEVEQRAAKELAEHATQTKSRFLAAASHDLRQPLQALRLYLSALSSRLDDDKALMLSEKMHLSLDTMSELLEALLDISSLESGRISVEIQDVNLKDLISRLAVSNLPHAQAKGLTFEANINDVMVKTDPSLLVRIIENFISNAIRYTKQGGIKIETSVSDENVRLSVIDSGIGIPKDALSTVFDEYYQLDNEVRDRSKGLGLGLSIVKHIARILDHKIFAESNQGDGSRFCIEIPLGDSLPSIEITSGFSIKLKSQAQNILIIDDESAVVDAMAEVLSLHDIDVTRAYSGVDALKQIVQGLRPTLIISDYRMPQLNGIETVNALRQELGEDVPVIIMTGDTSIDLIKGTKIDNFDVLSKPIHNDTLMGLVALIGKEKGL